MMLTEERWFSWRGRIGRLTYILRILAIVVGTFLSCLFLLKVNCDACVVPAMTFGYGLLLLQSIKRFHDLGYSSAWSLLLLVPGVHYAAIVYLVFAPGETGSNRFGPDPTSCEAD